jgi:hypothetical protein
VPSTGLTGVDPCSVSAKVNVPMGFPVSRFAIVSCLVCFEAREVSFLDLGFPGLDWSDR